MAFWSSFTNGTTYAVIAVIALLLVLWIFVV